jgi:hypothetical protein
VTAEVRKGWAALTTAVSGSGVTVAAGR